MVRDKHGKFRRRLILFSMCSIILLKCSDDSANKSISENIESPDLNTDSALVVKKQKMEYLLTMDSNIVPRHKRWTGEDYSLTAADTFDVDDYNLSLSIFKTASKQIVYSSGLESHHDVWCTNDTLKETIFIELYTDYHRNFIFHFKNEDIPADMLERISILKVIKHTGSVAPIEEKQKTLPGFIRQAVRLEDSAFTSAKGFQLGDPSKKALQIYGQPDTTYYSDGATCWLWSFAGDSYYDESKDYKGKPVARNSWGHEVFMYFRNEKLIGMALHNDIP